MTHYTDYKPAPEVPLLSHEYDVLVREEHMTAYHAKEMIQCNNYWKNALNEVSNESFWHGFRVGSSLCGGLGVLVGLLVAILLLTRP
jgi:hypothetical protein